MKYFKSLKSKLFFWYATSLIAVAAYFFLGIHIFSLPYGLQIFFLLLLALAIEGLVIIHKITGPLTKLTSKIRTITSKNLNEKIHLPQTDDEIGELSKSFNELLNRLDEAFKREQQFIGDVAHELKTPIATLKSGIEIALSKDRDTREYKGVLTDVLTDVDRLSSTLKDVLDLAWTQADQAKNLTRSFNLSNLIEELREIAIKMAGQKSIEVFGQTEKDLDVFGDKEKFSRAILNFLDNSIKYTPQKGKIELNLYIKDHDAVITIKDSGVGILSEDLPHIFDRFYRGSKTDKTLGSGLGLAIAQAIIKAHRGEIEVESKVGQGTIFTITISLKS